MNFSVVGKDNKFEAAVVLSKSYNAMADAFKQHSLVSAEEAETFGRNIKMLFDFSIKEVQGLEELAMKRNEFSDFYKFEKINLQLKKESAYSSKDLKKWEIDQERLPVPKLDLLSDKNLALRYMFPKVESLYISGNSRC